MDKKNLLIVESSNKSLHMAESASNKLSGLVLEGIFTVFNERNRNDRIYTASKFIPHMNELLERKSQLEVVYGEMDHPEGFEISLERASHTIEELTYNESKNNVTGKIELLPTHLGNQARAISESGRPIFVSSRAAGITESNGEVTIKKLFTYDLVGDPGFASTAMRKSLNESLGLPNDAAYAIYDMSTDNSLNEYVTDKGGDGNAEQITRAHFEEYKLHLESQIVKLSKDLMAAVQDKYAGEDEIAKLSQELEFYKESNEQLKGYVNMVSSRSNELFSKLEDRTEVLEKHSNLIADELEGSINYSQIIAEAVNASDEIIKNTTSKEIAAIAQHVNSVAEACNSNFDQIYDRLATSKKYADHTAEGINTTSEQLEDLANYVSMVSEHVNKLTAYSDLSSNELNKAIGYISMLGEHVNGSINFSEYIARESNKTQGYAEMLGERLNETINYSEMLAEKLNYSINYQEHIAENLDYSIKYQEHIAENLSNTMDYSNYLGENLDVVTTAVKDTIETQSDMADHADYVIETLNSNKGLLKESAGLQTLKEYAMHTNTKDTLVTLMNQLDDIKNRVASLMAQEDAPMTEVEPAEVEPMEIEEVPSIDENPEMGDVQDIEDAAADSDLDDLTNDDSSEFGDEDYQSPSQDEEDEEDEDPFGDDFAGSDDDDLEDLEDLSSDEDDVEDEDEDEDELEIEVELAEAVTESSHMKEGDMTEEGDHGMEDATEDLEELDLDDDQAYVDVEGAIDDLDEEGDCKECAYEAKDYVKVLSENKIGVVEEVHNNKRYTVNIGGKLVEYAEHELEAKNHKSQNYSSDIKNMINEIKKREASKNLEDPHFFTFLTEQSKAAFDKLSPEVKEEVVAVAEQRTYYSEADVLAIIREVTTEQNETFEQRLLRNMPNEIKPIWEKLSYSQKQEKLHEATFFPLNSDLKMKHFWETRRFENKGGGRKLIAESLNNDSDVALPSDENIDAFMDKFRTR